MTAPAPLADQSSCGSCRHHIARGRAALHEQCIARAQLIPAPDAPCYETILDTPEDQRARLPARFHIPVYDDAGTPKSWSCAVCWGDGWATRWPCATAQENGRDVFTPEHLADQARQDVPALLAEVDRLRAESENRRQHAAAADVSAGVLQQQIDAQASEIDRLRAQLAGVWPCVCSHLPDQHRYDTAIGRNFCRSCRPNEDLHDYAAAPSA